MEPGLVVLGVVAIVGLVVAAAMTVTKPTSLESVHDAGGCRRGVPRGHRTPEVFCVERQCVDTYLVQQRHVETFLVDRGYQGTFSDMEYRPRVNM